MRLLVNRLIIDLLRGVGIGCRRVCVGLAQRGMCCKEKCDEQKNVFQRSPPRNELRLVVRLVRVSVSCNGIPENVKSRPKDRLRHTFRGG